ncbi:MAG: hypothetical protein QW423_02345 [Candidatus Aenigmatarchaeota archaeon]
MESFEEIVKRCFYFKRVYPLNEPEYGKSLFASKNFFDNLGIKINNILIKFKPISRKVEKNKFKSYLTKSPTENIYKRLEEEWFECRLLKSKFFNHYYIFYDPIAQIQIEEIFYATNEWFNNYELSPGIKILIRIPGEYLL